VTAVGDGGGYNRGTLERLEEKGEVKNRMTGLDPSGSGLGAATARTKVELTFLHHDG
jgi:hypothetical protein